MSITYQFGGKSQVIAQAVRAIRLSCSGRWQMKPPLGETKLFFVNYREVTFTNLNMQQADFITSSDRTRVKEYQNLELGLRAAPGLLNLRCSTSQESSVRWNACPLLTRCGQTLANGPTFI